MPTVTWLVCILHPELPLYILSMMGLLRVLSVAYYRWSWRESVNFTENPTFVKLSPSYTMFKVPSGIQIKYFLRYNFFLSFSSRPSSCSQWVFVRHRERGKKKSCNEENIFFLYLKGLWTLCNWEKVQRRLEIIPLWIHPNSTGTPGLQKRKKSIHREIWGRDMHWRIAFPQISSCIRAWFSR